MIFVVKFQDGMFVVGSCSVLDAKKIDFKAPAIENIAKPCPDVCFTYSEAKFAV